MYAHARPKIIIVQFRRYSDEIFFVSVRLFSQNFNFHLIFYGTCKLNKKFETILVSSLTSEIFLTVFLGNHTNFRKWYSWSIMEFWQYFDEFYRSFKSFSISIVSYSAHVQTKNRIPWFRYGIICGSPRTFSRILNHFYSRYGFYKAQKLFDF